MRRRAPPSHDSSSNSPTEPPAKHDGVSLSRCSSPKAFDAEIVNCVSDLRKKLHSSIVKISTCDKTIQQINDLPSTTNKSTRQQRLKSFYQTLLKETDAESDALRNCLDGVARLKALRVERRMVQRGASPTSAALDRVRGPPLRRGALMMLLQQSAASLPLFIGRRLYDRAPALCGAIGAPPNYVCRVGDTVAAKVKVAPASGVSPLGVGPEIGERDVEQQEESWILAEVVVYNAANAKYEIDDIDEEQKGRYVLSRKKVVPLPLMRANPETNPEAIFAVESIVWALYPQTTCFYRGVVQKTPANAADSYTVKFEDPSYPDGFSPGLPVAQKYVIAIVDASSNGGGESSARVR